MRTAQDPAPGAPWYRERWPWILAGLPAAAVAACIATLVLAIRSDDGVVADDYYKQGLGINRVLERGERARQMGLSAELALAGAPPRGGARLVATLRGAVTAPAAIRLRLIHPTRAGEDLQVTLVARGDGSYAGEVPVPAWGLRRLVLEDPAGQWRLQGVWDPGARATRLDGEAPPAR